MPDAPGFAPNGGDVPTLAECDECGTGVCLALAWEGSEPLVVLACDCRNVAAEGFEVESLANRWK